MEGLVICLDLGCVRLYVLTCADAESPVYVCWQFWMCANTVGYMLSNQLVMLCVDDELLCGFILTSKFIMARFCICLPVDNNS